MLSPNCWATADAVSGRGTATTPLQLRRPKAKGSACASFAARTRTSLATEPTRVACPTSMVSTIYHLSPLASCRLPALASEKGISAHSICISGRKSDLVCSLEGDSTFRSPAARARGFLAAVAGPRTFASAAFAFSNSVSKIGLAILIRRYHEGSKRRCHASSSDTTLSSASFCHTQAALDLNRERKIFGREGDGLWANSSRVFTAIERLSKSWFNSSSMTRQWSASMMGVMRTTKSTCRFVRSQQDSTMITRFPTSVSACLQVEHTSINLAPILTESGTLF